MKCPKCQIENRKGANFCRQCGFKFERTCPSCGHPYPDGFAFCDKCGCHLQPDKPASDKIPENKASPISPSPNQHKTAKHRTDETAIIGERKHVTVLFSDLTGYTAMSEKLDPEDIKEITSRIFGEVSEIVSKYDGFIEKYAGDAVMAMFGVPTAHEDDPVRAVKAAREIHERVNRISPEIEAGTGQPVSMHTGITTGLVVTGDVNMKIGTHGSAGDTINCAARLSSLAKPDEILIDMDTCRQSEGHFECEYFDTAPVKGKSHPVQIHKVLTQRDKPVTIHRLSGMRANLVGRKVELAQMEEAVGRLREGTGAIFSICGDAGTGKSRLVEEFKSTLDLKKVQWLEGHAYAYSQNIPYFLLIDLLNGAFQIQESDSPEKVREKIESRLEYLAVEKDKVAPYVGSLYALSYPETENLDPEFWKSRLQKAIQATLSALARRQPAVICLEDLHWADPSSIDLVRTVLTEFRYPALFLCVYRPSFSIFTTHQVSGMGKVYREMKLQDLSTSESQDMVESLLKTDTVPNDLRRFIQEKVEGNPFYLEEVINALIESAALIRDNGSWLLTRPISESDISSTIHGVISARLDRLEKETKRILQEASVIGKAFLYKILKQVTNIDTHIDKCLSSLERFDLIRTRSFQPELEYVFKHALTQDVVYSGLLKKERQAIHERIALIMEQLFHDRLPEFYETLAFHFKQGRSIHKAVEYLMKSGEKSLKRYAVEESHQYYREGFELLSSKPDKSKKEKGLLIDLLNQWSKVFYYRGDFKGMNNVLKPHEKMAELLEDETRLGNFYVWLGIPIYMREGFRESHQYFMKALALGEKTDDLQITGHACMWLCFTFGEMGLHEKAILFGKRARKIAESLVSDQFLFFKSLGGMGFNYFFMGETKKSFELGKTLLDYGNRHSNVRSLVVGHISIRIGYLNAGNFSSAIETFQRGIETSADPFYIQWPKMFLGMTYVQNNQFEEAEKALLETSSYAAEFGCEQIGSAANAFLGVLQIVNGHFSKGLEMLLEVRQLCLKNERKSSYVVMEYLLGKVYFQIVAGEEKISLLTMAKNIGFVVKNVPFAAKHAEAHFNQAISTAIEIGARGVEGQALLDLGRLHKVKGRKEKARECFTKAIKIFEECEAEVFLQQASEALGGLA